MVRDHPLLGVGPDNFLYAYRTRYVLPTAWEQFDLSHPHNVVLDFATRLGLPGVVAFAALQIAFWRRALSQYRDRRRRALVLGAMGVMANFLGHGLVDASYFVIDLAFVFYLTLALVVWAERAPSAGSTLPPPG
jgi:O-antigen ligase